MNILTREEHSKRRPKLSTCTSGVTGVCWNKGTQKWKAYITVNGKYEYLGVFEDRNEAIKARQAAEKDHGFHPTHGKTDEEAREILAAIEALKG